MAMCVERARAGARVLGLGPAASAEVFRRSSRGGLDTDVRNVDESSMSRVDRDTERVSVCVSCGIARRYGRAYATDTLVFTPRARPRDPDARTRRVYGQRSAVRKCVRMGCPRSYSVDDFTRNSVARPAPDPRRRFAHLRRRRQQSSAIDTKPSRGGASCPTPARLRESTSMHHWWRAASAPPDTPCSPAASPSDNDSGRSSTRRRSAARRTTK